MFVQEEYPTLILYINIDNDLTLRLLEWPYTPRW